MCFLQVLNNKSHFISFWHSLNRSEFVLFRWWPTLSGRCSFILLDLISALLPRRWARRNNSPLISFHSQRMISRSEQIKLELSYTNSADSVQYLYSLHFKEGGHLKGFLPQKQLTFQLHAEEDVLARVRLNAEAVLPLVHQLIVLKWCIELEWCLKHINVWFYGLAHSQNKNKYIIK